MKALFTSLPVDLAISVIKQKFPQDSQLHSRTSMSIQHIPTLLECCLKSTYFLCQCKYYEQVHGSAMGSHISVIVANLFMKEFECKAISTTPIHQGYGLGMWMTPLSSKRQNTASSSYIISTPLTHTYSSLHRFPATMDPYHFWTL